MGRLSELQKALNGEISPAKTGSEPPVVVNPDFRPLVNALKAISTQIAEIEGQDSGDLIAAITEGLKPLQERVDLSPIVEAIKAIPKPSETMTFDIHRNASGNIKRVVAKPGLPNAKDGPAIE